VVCVGRKKLRTSSLIVKVKRILGVQIRLDFSHSRTLHASLVVIGVVLLFLVVYRDTATVCHLCSILFCSRGSCDILSHLCACWGPRERWKTRHCSLNWIPEHKASATWGSSLLVRYAAADLPISHLQFVWNCFLPAVFLPVPKFRVVLLLLLKDFCSGVANPPLRNDFYYYIRRKLLIQNILVLLAGFFFLSEVAGSHSGEYEVHSLLGYSAVIHRPDCEGSSQLWNVG
jgi:hypothetical protein